MCNQLLLESAVEQNLALNTCIYICSSERGPHCCCQLSICWLATEKWGQILLRGAQQRDERQWSQLQQGAFWPNTRGKKKGGGGGRIRMAKSLDRETMKPSSLELFKTWLAEARAPWSTFAVASVLASNWSTWLPEVPFNLNYTVCLHQVEFQQWNF